MRLSTNKVNRFLQRTWDKEWRYAYYRKDVFLFIATLPPHTIKDGRITIKISKKELGNRLHTDFEYLSRTMNALVDSGLLKKESGYDTVNVVVSFPKNFLFEDE